MNFRLIFTLPLLCAIGCGAGDTASKTADPSAARKVRLQLNWYPEAEHGGYFAALEKGYFAEEGLDVEIISGGPNAPVIPQLDTGKVEFAVANADNLLIGRGAGAEVVAVLAPLQISPRCIIVHEESGITNFDELRDVTLAVSQTSIFFEYLKSKSPLRGVNLVPYSGNIAQFLENPRYAQQGYVFSEPYLVEQHGKKVRSLMLADLGFNPYTSLLVTRRELVENDPELVRKMTRASRRGWETYLTEPARANAEIIRRNSDMNEEVLNFGVEQLQTLCLPDGTTENDLGRMTPDRWESLHRQLLDLKLIEADTFRIEQAYSLDFLPGSE